MLGLKWKEENLKLGVVDKQVVEVIYKKFYLISGLV